MTVLQLKIVVYANRLGSISSAAKELEISQPNASNSIKSLENEIGYQIFNRTKSGTFITEKGYMFLEHAKRVLDELDEIDDIKNRAGIYRLRLGAVNYVSAAEPLLKLCEMHRHDTEADFRFFNVSIDEGINELENHNLDVVFAPAMKSQLTGVVNACKKKKLTLISLGKIPAVISVRKDHPAALDGRCENITQGSDVMKDFPYVAYRNLYKDSGSTGYNDTNFIQSSYVIYADEVSVRLRLVASSNAFCFGITTSKGLNDLYGLVSFPVPGISLEVFIITRSADRDRKEIKEYISLLKQELQLE